MSEGLGAFVIVLSALDFCVDDNQVTARYDLGKVLFHFTFLGVPNYQDNRCRLCWC